jgi:hypothetical protein
VKKEQVMRKSAPEQLVEGIAAALDGVDEHTPGGVREDAQRHVGAAQPQRRRHAVPLSRSTAGRWRIEGQRARREPGADQACPWAAARRDGQEKEGDGDCIPTPRLLFDDWLDKLGGSELKCLLVVLRYATGCRRDDACLSLSALCRYSGLSMPSVVRAMAGLVQRGLILRHKSEGHDPRRWSINLPDKHQPIGQEG